MAAAAIILAGGDGTRLRSFTRRLTGDDRPRQFCALLGGERSSSRRAGAPPGSSRRHARSSR